MSQRLNLYKGRHSKSANECKEVELKEHESNVRFWLILINMPNQFFKISVKRSGKTLKKLNGVNIYFFELFVKIYKVCSYTWLESSEVLYGKTILYTSLFCN